MLFVIILKATPGETELSKATMGTVKCRWSGSVCWKWKYQL